MAERPLVRTRPSAKMIPQQAAQHLVAAELAEVEGKLLDVCGADDEPLVVAARGVIEAGGKRLRAALTLLAARAVGETNETTVDLAVSIEVTHLASLMHDDVVDEATLRRGRPAVREVWGNRTAVLAGDYLAARAYRQLADLRNWTYLEILADVAMGMCRAESRLGMTDPGEVSVQDCLWVAHGKTAGLFAAACRLGALSAGAPEETAAMFGSYGEHLGIAFQITDDLLDIYGEEKTTGKEPGRDILTGQVTLPVAEALQSDQGSAIRELISRLSREGESRADLARLASLVEAGGGRAAAEAVTVEHVELAKAALRNLPGARPDALEALAQTADYILARQG